MTISTTQTKIIYNGDGSNRRFDIPFPFLTDEDVKVFTLDAGGAQTDVSTKADISADRTYITYPANEGEPALGKDFRLVVMRQTALTQENDLIQQATLHKESLEKSLDKLTMISQEVQERLGRTVTMGVSDEGEPSVANLINEMRSLYADIKAKVQTATEEAQKAIEAAVSAYEQAEKLYSSVEWYTAGTPEYNYTGDLQEFKLQDSYKCDQMTLKVFVNGQIKRPGSDYDYEEISNPELMQEGTLFGDMVRFTNPLQSGDVVCFTWGDTLTMPGGEVAQAAASAAESAQASAEQAANSAEEAKTNASTFIPKQIGEVYYSQSSKSNDNLGALSGWTGDLIKSAKTSHPALYAFVQAHPERCKTKQEYDAILAETGEVLFYVLDDEGEGNLRLPVYKRSLSSSGGIVGASSPDYAKGETVDTSGTIKQDGWLFVYGWVYMNSYVYAEINGKKRTCNYVNSCKYNNAIGVNIPLRVKKGDVYAITGSGTYSISVEFVPCVGIHDTDVYYDYPWIVAQNAIEGLLKHNGGFLNVKLYTAAEWNALQQKPENEFSLIEEEIR